MKHPAKLALDVLGNSLAYATLVTFMVALHSVDLIVPRILWVFGVIWATYLFAAVPFVVVGYRHERQMAAFLAYREALAANEAKGDLPTLREWRDAFAELREPAATNDANNAAPRFQRDRKPEFVG